MTARYAKAFSAVVVTVLAFLVSVMTDGITAQEWVLTIGTGLSATGVAVVPNLPVGIGAAAKAIVTFLIAGTTALSVLILGGLTTAEVIEVIVAACASVGIVAIVPNIDDYRDRASLRTSGSVDTGQAA